MTTYKDLYRHPLWQRRRLEIMKRAEFRCEECDDAETTLNVHHRLYRKGARPWEYEDHELQCLCEKCHEAVTHTRQLLDKAIAELSSERLMELLGFAESIVATDYAMGDVPLQDLQHREWPLRSYEHAWGFAARLFYGIDPLDLYALIDMQPVSHREYWNLAAGALTLKRPDV